jgi:predicted SAM-dependent methyltransferase
VKLNLGCGSNKINGCVNIDAEANTSPDLLLNFCTHSLPYHNHTVDVIYLFHTIEHIPEKHHPFLISECWRVLKPGGLFYVSYPEFTKCAQNYIDNKRGMREFWKATIYGRQLWPTDTHITLMDTTEFLGFLRDAGFDAVAKPEPQEDYNTIIRAVACEKPPTYEQQLAREYK